MKKTHLKRKSKTLTAKLRNLADRLYQEKLKGKICEICGKPSTCVHHFVPKSVSNRLRYDPKNAIPICQGCHMRHHQAGDPVVHLTIQRKRGKKWLDYITKARYEMVKTDKIFYDEAIAKLDALT